jgi:CTP synthase (UTP-ammonia lyase)
MDYSMQTGFRKPDRTLERSMQHNACAERGLIIGIVGDRNPHNALHLASEQAIAENPDHPAVEWISTDRIRSPDERELSRYAGFLIAPGSPYRDMDGVLTAIRYAREQRVPLLGTCGGFQHLIVEFVRNVLGVTDADHEESNPNAPHLAVTALQCSLAGQIHRVRLIAGTHAQAIYGSTEVFEPFYCNYGLNPQFQPRLEPNGLRVSGWGEDGEVRIVELSGHPFFFGTLYVPQARHERDAPHVLIRALVAAAGRHELKATPPCAGATMSRN